jgi:hypothetical protein
MASFKSHFKFQAGVPKEVREALATAVTDNNRVDMEEEASV